MFHAFPPLIFSKQDIRPPKKVLEDDLSLSTLCVSQHVQTENKVCLQRPLVTPIYTSSSYTIPNISFFEDIVATGNGYIYSRLGNPTEEQAQVVISSLEGGAGSLLFASGLAAINVCVLGLLGAGDHIVVSRPCYSAFLSFANNHLPRFGIEVTFVDSKNADNFKKAIKSNTKMLCGETPVNPTVDILDIETFAKIGRENNVLTFVDSTFASPYHQRPIADYGVDISMHSCTKYLGGHSDLVGGCLTFKSEEIWRKMRKFSHMFGAVMCPQTCSLLVRGIKTLGVRMERISANALRVAQFLESHEKIQGVNYPGLPSYPQYAIAHKQMKRGFGGVIAFQIKGGLEACDRFTKNLKLIHLAVSLGGTESLLCHPASMIHGSIYMSEAEREAAGINEGSIRFSVGLEDVEDIQHDLSEALKHV